MNKSNWKIYGNQKPTVLIAGHSHSFPLFMAVQNGQRFQNIFGVATQADFSKSLERDQSYWEFVARNSKNKTVAILWNGNQHNFHFLIDTNEPFKVFGLMDGTDEVPAISISRIEALFEPTFKELRQVLSLFGKSKKIILIETPPPKSKIYIDSQLHKDPFFLGIAKQLNLPKSNLRATSDALRIAMWKITQNLTREIANHFNAQFVELPNETFDSKGLLAQKFWTDDLSHANEKFGALLMDHLLATQGLKIDNSSI